MQWTRSRAQVLKDNVEDPQPGRSAAQEGREGGLHRLILEYVGGGGLMYRS